MGKTIHLNESAFKILKNVMISEAIGQTSAQPSPIFGKSDNYIGDLATLAKISNLRNDRYKDYELDEAWKAWKESGYDKNDPSYLSYRTCFEKFMFGDRGFLRHISYTLDRLKPKEMERRLPNGSIEKYMKTSNCQLHQAILDKGWVSSLNSNPNWKFSDLGENDKNEAYHCFYSTVLKLYQNPAIWNDFFFNPLFNNDVRKYVEMVKKISASTDKLKYLQILPKQEYVEINKFMGKVDPENMIPMFNVNTNEDAFYEKVENVSDETDDDEFSF